MNVGGLSTRNIIRRSVDAAAAGAAGGQCTPNPAPSSNPAAYDRAVGDGRPWRTTCTDGQPPQCSVLPRRAAAAQDAPAIGQYPAGVSYEFVSAAISGPHRLACLPSEASGTSTPGAAGFRRCPHSLRRRGIDESLSISADGSVVVSSAARAIAPGGWPTSRATRRGRTGRVAARTAGGPGADRRGHGARRVADGRWAAFREGRQIYRVRVTARRRRSRRVDRAEVALIKVWAANATPAGRQTV